MKLISLNIERNKHYATVLPFLKKEAADVICLQEVPDEFAVLVEELGYNVHFAKEHIYTNETGSVIEGLLIASKKPLQNIERLYYNKTKDILPVRDENNYWETNPLLCLFVTIDGMRIGTTHFPVALNRGLISTYQEKAIINLEEIIKKLPPHLLCGDFNVARGHNPVYERLTALYTDQIPPTFSSSMDKSLHRLGGDSEKAFIFTDLMVDYIFTQPPYTADNVRLEFGVSDHAAVVCDITKK